MSKDRDSDRAEFEAELEAERLAEQDESELDFSEETADEDLGLILDDDEPEPDDGGAPAQPAAPRPRRQTEAENAAELEQWRRQQQQQQFQADLNHRAQLAAQEFDELETWDWERRRAHFIQERQRQVLIQRLQAADTADKSDFYARRPLSEKATKQVEATLADARNRGINATREETYTWLLVQRQLARKSGGNVARSSGQAPRRGRSGQDARDEAILGDFLRGQ
jgi:hypothetical protein